MELFGIVNKDLLTLIIAFWGAGLSTVLVLLKLKSEFKANITVICYIEKLSDGVTIRAVNVGPRPREITEVGFLKGKKPYINKKVTKGKIRLELGESTVQNFDINKVIENIDSLTEIYARDSTGNIHKAALSRDIKDRIRSVPIYNLISQFLEISIQQLKKFKKLQENQSLPIEKLQEKFEEYKDRDEKINSDHVKYTKYLEETGNIHPELEKSIKRIMDEYKTAYVKEKRELENYSLKNVDKS